MSRRHSDSGDDSGEQQQQPKSDEPAQEAEGDSYAELERLAELKEKGVITEEEFAAKKKQILGL